MRKITYNLFCEDCKKKTSISFYGEKTKHIILSQEMNKHSGHKLSFKVEENIKEMDIRIRPMLDWMKEYYYIYDNYKLNGLEIGVAEGEGAFAFLNCLPIRKLYLVDPYKEYKEKDKTQDYSKSKKIMLNRLKDFKKKIIFINDFSQNAYKKIPDNSLDFIYIDGNHQYEFIKKDLELYWPKLKVDGIMGGHDFGTTFIDIIIAVLEFKVSVNSGDIKGKDKSSDRDWWFIKLGK
jgi:hypothetical protein